MLGASLPACQWGVGGASAAALTLSQACSWQATCLHLQTSLPCRPLPHRGRGLLNLSVKQKSDFLLSLRCLQLPAC